MQPEFRGGTLVEGGGVEKESPLLAQCEEGVMRVTSYA